MKLTNYYFILFLTLMFLSCGLHKETQHILTSPNGKIDFFVKLEQSKDGVKNNLLYSMNVNGKNIINNSKLEIQFKDMPPIGSDLVLVDKTESSHDEYWERIWGRSRKVRNNYNEMILSFEEIEAPKRRIDIIARAYDDGAAFRYNIPEQDGMKEFSISSENTEFDFNDNHTVWAAEYGFVSHQEEHFNKMTISDINDKIIGLPLLIKIEDEIWISISEAELTDWAGMFLSSKSDSILVTKLAPRNDDSTLVVKSNSKRQTPWRVIMVGNSEGAFLESNIIQNLNEPCAIENTDWIKPGKSAWDWWWSNRYAPDVDFEVGSNTETMKYFIDFASEMNWEYQLVDWHWYGDPFKSLPDNWANLNQDADILTENPDINIPELVEYAKERNVRLLLWLEWEHAERQMEEAFPLYEKWGVAGVKVDFMMREDQEMVNFYHKLVKLAAKHHLIVDFHGAYKPTGISRTYPNLMTREGVKGNEYTKWSEDITPEHNTTIAYTRNMLGEMDYTPGAFLNVTKDNFIGEEDQPSPMVMNTRCQQLAMLIVYESALQVLCDSPYNYRRSPAGLNFLKQVPTTWDETRFLQGKIGEYITVARRNGNVWYVGTLNNSTEREIELKFDFLEDDVYTAHIWRDGPNADTDPRSLTEETIEIRQSDDLIQKLAIGGGHIMRISKNN